MVILIFNKLPKKKKKKDKNKQERQRDLVTNLEKFEVVKRWGGRSSGPSGEGKGVKRRNGRDFVKWDRWPQHVEWFFRWFNGL